MATLLGIYFQSIIEAETDVRLVLSFRPPISAEDTTLLRCQLHDPVFNINHCLGDIRVTDLEVATGPEINNAFSKSISMRALSYLRVMKLKFPESLAGGCFRMEFLVSKNHKELAGDIDSQSAFKENTDVYFKEYLKKIFNNKKVNVEYRPFVSGNFTTEITVESCVSGSPKIHDVYIGNNESLKFGEDSTINPSLKRTASLGAVESPLIHIHTRGMYGKMVFGKQNRTSFSTRIIDNKVMHTAGYYGYDAGNTAKHMINIRVAKSELELSGSGTYKSTSIGVQLNKVNPITVSTTATNASTGKNSVPIAKSDAKCKVEFRPASTYNGEFGFSWYRFGDTNLFQATRAVTNSRLSHTFNAIVPSNDQAFADIMGHHFETVGGVRTVVRNGNNSSSHADFAVDSQMSRNHRFDYQRIEMPHIYATDPNDPADPKKPENEYYIPCMTLCKGKIAELQLLITVNSSPDKLIFGFDNPKALSEGFLKLSLSEIASPAVNPMDATQQIKIECLKEFSKPLQLNVWAETSDPTDKNKKSRHLCGAVNILPNDLYHQRNINVVFFNVKTKLNQTNTTSLDGINANSTQQNKIDALKKYLLQAYINPLIEVVDLDLVDAVTNVTDSGYTSCCIPDPNNPGSFLYIDNSHNGELEDFLVQKVDPKYEHYFKIFFIPDPHQSLNGFSSGRREKFTVCFYDALKETPVHELLHSLGLPHTFDGSTSRAKYVYEDGMTDNLMDYSHQNSPYGSTPRQSLFHWQWQSLNIKL